MDLSKKRLTNLHVSHSWGGGLGKWVRDFSGSDEASNNLVLKCVGTGNCYGIGHRLIEAGTCDLMEEWTLDDPIAEVRATHPDYRARLDRIVEEYRVNHVYVSSLAGHTLDVFDLGLPVTRIHHDYFPWCPAFYCYRGKPCTSCTEEDLEACRNGPYPTPINHYGYFRDLRDHLLEKYGDRNVMHVAPSASVVRQMRGIDARFCELDYHLIEHGLDLTRMDLFGGAPDGQPLRLGLFGPLAWHKGLDVLRSDLDRLRLIADFVLFGSGEATSEFEERIRVKTVRAYEPRELHTLLQENPIDIALFLSVVPETFSYTLSEVWAFGIPPLAHRRGAFEDRIRAGENGFLFELGNDGLLEEMLRLDTARSEIREVAKRCAGMPVRTARDMVRDYYALRGSEVVGTTGIGEIAREPWRAKVTR